MPEEPPSLILRFSLSLLGAAITTTMAYMGMKYLFTDFLDPSAKEKRNDRRRAKILLKSLGVSNSIVLTDYEMCIANNLIVPNAMRITWSNIAGLSDLIREIQESVILPFTRDDLCSQSALLQAPKGVLLYGPPGCGKTMIAKAIAGTTDARFLHLQVSSLLDKWYGESEKRVDAVFSLAEKLQPTILFLDEVDALFTTRTSADHESTRILKTQFMTLWDGLLTASNSKILIIGATNRADQIDKALVRRMPCRFYIGLPNKFQRADILQLILSTERVDSNIDYGELSGLCDGLSGSDLREICRDAVISSAKSLLLMQEMSRSCEAIMDPTTTSPIRMGSKLNFRRPKSIIKSDQDNFVDASEDDIDSSTDIIKIGNRRPPSSPSSISLSSTTVITPRLPPLTQSILIAAIRKFKSRKDLLHQPSDLGLMSPMGTSGYDL